MIICQDHYLFTSESVTEGHPDKVADLISDAVLDCLIGQDANSRVACEALVTTGMAFIAGEISTSAYADLPSLVRETIKGIGYNSSDMGFDWETCAVMSAIDKQSADIAQGVNRQKP
ncbi:MAG: S-adenosylmethionine synthetase N-terminal domain-containing protein, partial [Desulfovibrionales bacterium]